MIVEGALRAIRGFMTVVEEVVAVVVIRVVIVVSGIMVDEVGAVLVCGKSVSAIMQKEMHWTYSCQGPRSHSWRGRRGLQKISK
jgi:hypothetical protein